ncbi:hypothetical protein ACFL6K_05305 [Candidatus Latescibacterota bacterium]
MSYTEKKSNCSYPGCKNDAQRKRRFCYEHSKESRGKTTAYIKRNSLYDDDKDEGFNDINENDS